MLVTQLKNALDSFFLEENDSQTLLIDGKWGCGKTYELKKYLKDARDQYAYISLFGLKSYEEIVLRLAEFLDSSLVSLSNGHYYINTSIDDNESHYNNCFIIFDDLERKDVQLSFSSILCVIDSLRSHGFKIICVTSSEKIKQKGEFEDFKDKVIDELYYVHGDYSVFPSVVNGLSHLSFEKAMLEEVDDNWRIVKRAASLYSRIVKYAENIKIKDANSYLGLSSLDLFRSCCIALACYFINNDKTPQFNDNDIGDFQKYNYETNKEAFSSESIANNLYKFFTLKKENQTFEEHVINVLHLVSNGDYDVFFNRYKKEKIIIEKPVIKEKKQSLKPIEVPVKPTIAPKASPKTAPKAEPIIVPKASPTIAPKASPKTAPKAEPIEDILDKEYFLLDDKGRDSYIQSFFNNLNSFSFNRVPERRMLSSVLVNCSKDMSVENKKKIIQRIVDTVPLDKSNDFMIELFGRNSKKEVKEIKNEIADAFGKVEEKKNNDNLLNLVKNKDYEALTNLVFNYKYSPPVTRNRLAKQFKEHDYCLPELSEEITRPSWTFCNEIASFIQSTEYSNDFINNLVAKCVANPKSKSLLDKCHALVKYNFNISEESFDLMIKMNNLI